MPTIIVQVWLVADAEISQRTGQFLIVEVKADDFEHFCEMVDDDRLICGEILFTRRIDQSSAEIFKRHQIAFRGSAVARCQPNTVQCVEAA